jgi:uncharacterized membrane protein
MQKFHRALSYFIFGLNGLLVFFWFFKDGLVIPSSLQVMGRMHPMLLHLPIGFFILSVILLLLKSNFKKKSFQKTYQLMLALTAITLVVTALMGVALSKEGGYDEATLNLHLNLGVLISLLSAIFLGIPFDGKFSKAFYGVTTLGTILIIATGHYGATLTHGEGYLLAPLKDNNIAEVNPDSLTVFNAAIFPVLERKCLTCHNPKKKKGELILVDKENILKGGENGLVLVPGKPQESELVKRIHLEIKHDDHMPPSGKPQLTSNEILLLEMWIGQGAEFKKFWNSYLPIDSLRMLGNAVLATYEKPTQRQYDFDFASSEKVKALNTPFRSVSQVSLNSPALKADFYLAKFFKPSDLQELSGINLQLTQLNLSGMPVTDSDVRYLEQFKNLENLYMNNTKISNKAFTHFNSLPNLKKLSVAGTKVSSEAFNDIALVKSLREVYLWNTPLTETEIEKLKKKFPNITWDSGFKLNVKEILKLTPPILKNENFVLGEQDAVEFKHNLPGTQIRYTLDGSTPDSVNGKVYTQAITLNKHTIIKAISTKDEWRKSNEVEYQFYKNGIQPTEALLISKAHKDYKAGGAASLVDGQIGDANNFREGTWLGFKETNFESSFLFKNDTRLVEVAIIINKNIGSYILPPKEVEIWGGQSESDLRLLKRITPVQPLNDEPTKTEAIMATIDCNCSLIKIKAAPIAKLPAWHSGKGEKGWVMIGEVIFR